MDRKAWIVVIICSILLVLNLHFAGKNSAAKRQAQLDQEKEEQAANPDLQDADDPPELTVERPEVPEELGESKPHDLLTSDTKFTLSTLEGGIIQAELLKQKAVRDDSNVKMNDLGLSRLGALTKISGESLERGYYSELKGAIDDQKVTYVGRTANNLISKKTWEKVDEGAGSEYRLSFTLELANDTEAEISLDGMAIFSGSAAPVYEDERPNYLNFFWNENGNFDSETNGFFSRWFGADPTEFRREMEENLLFSGVENQFFATIVTPKSPYPATYRVIQKEIDLPESRGGSKGNSFNTYLSLPDEMVPAGGKVTLVYDIFMGPKNNALIRTLDGDKDEVMDYGWFGWISHPLNVTLNFLSNLFGGDNVSWSWGWAIVVLTLIIRTLMWPLHAKSTRTMKRMSKLQPKMAALKEKYKDDPNKMNQETMKLYREFGVNPMGGCLPMLVQIPVFFGFYNMLQYAVELRHQPFLGWVTDLSQPDTITTVAGIPINILPILMAVTMVIQMQLTPKTGDKMQQRIFMLMPLVFFFFCYNFASALALYWTTQNIFSIGQTWLMQKMPEPELKKSKKAGKKSFVQKLAEKAEAAQKSQQAQKGGQGRAGRQPGQKQAKPKKPKGPRPGG